MVRKKRGGKKQKGNKTRDERKMREEGKRIKGAAKRGSGPRDNVLNTLIYFRKSRRNRRRDREQLTRPSNGGDANFIVAPLSQRLRSRQQCIPRLDRV